MNRDTRIQHHGEEREALGGGAAPPIFRTSLFTFEDTATFEKSYIGEGERPVVELAKTLELSQNGDSSLDRVPNLLYLVSSDSVAASPG